MWDKDDDVSGTGWGTNNPQQPRNVGPTVSRSAEGLQKQRDAARKRAEAVKALADAEAKVLEQCEHLQDIVEDQAAVEAKHADAEAKLNKQREKVKVQYIEGMKTDIPGRAPGKKKSYIEMTKAIRTEIDMQKKLETEVKTLSVQGAKLSVTSKSPALRSWGQANRDIADVMGKEFGPEYEKAWKNFTKDRSGIQLESMVKRRSEIIAKFRGSMLPEGQRENPTKMHIEQFKAVNEALKDMAYGSAAGPSKGVPAVPKNVMKVYAQKMMPWVAEGPYKMKKGAVSSDAVSKGLKGVIPFGGASGGGNIPQPSYSAGTEPSPGAYPANFPVWHKLQGLANIKASRVADGIAQMETILPTAISNAMKSMTRRNLKRSFKGDVYGGVNTTGLPLDLVRQGAGPTNVDWAAMGSGAGVGPGLTRAQRDVLDVEKGIKEDRMGEKKTHDFSKWGTIKSSVSANLSNMMQQHAANIVVDATQKIKPLMTAENVNVPPVFEEPEFLNAMMNKALGGTRSPVAQMGAIAAKAATVMAAPNTSLAAQFMGSKGGNAYESFMKTQQQGPPNLAGPSYLGRSDVEGSIGFRKTDWQGNVFTNKLAYQAAQQAAINLAMGKQATKLQEIAGIDEVAADALRETISNMLPPTVKMKNFLKTFKGIHATEDQLLKAAQEIQDKWVSAQPKEVQNIIKGMQNELPTPEEMVGKDWFVRYAADNQEDIEKAQQMLQAAPGFSELTTGNLQEAGAMPGTGVKRTVFAKGRVGSVEDAQKILDVQQQITGLQSTDADKTSLLLSERKASIGVRMLETGRYLKRVNKELVQSQMAMLGVYFSMMSVTNMLGQAWGKVAAQVGNLENMFKGIGEALAFGRKGTKSYDLVKGMLKDTKGLVGAWKNYTGVMGLFSSMMTAIAYKLFTDVRLVDKIYEIIDKLAEILMDPAFMENLITLFKNLVNALPDVVSGLGLLVGLFAKLTSIPGMDKFIGFMVGIGLAAAVAMPVLAVFGSAVQGLSVAFKGIGMFLESAGGLKLWRLLTGKAAGGQTTLASFGISTGTTTAITEFVTGIGAAGGAAIIAAIVLALDAWIYDVGGFRTCILKMFEDASTNVSTFATEASELIKNIFGGIVLTNETFAMIWDGILTGNQDQAKESGNKLAQAIADGVQAGIAGSVDPKTGKRTGGIAEAIATMITGDSAAFDWQKAMGSVAAHILIGVGSAVLAALTATGAILQGIADGIAYGLEDADWSKLDAVGAKIGFAILNRVKKIIPGWSVAEGFMETTMDYHNQAQPRALGGSVFANQAYLVGENGPELFVPGVSGGVVPNGQITGGGGGDIYVTNNVGAVNSVANLREVLDAMNMSAKYSYGG